VTRLTPNFTLEELRGKDAPPRVRQNLQKTANGLQAFRDILGVPLRITSGYRSPDRNDDIGGSPTSDHVAGLAADVSTRLTLEQVAERLREYQARGGKLPIFDQLIFYPYTTGHLHLGFGQRMRRAVMIKNKERGYAWATGTPYNVWPPDFKPAA
jgi:zinc D-Ala-D-Ala carboxypeptidase